MGFEAMDNQRLIWSYLKTKDMHSCIQQAIDYHGYLIKRLIPWGPMAPIVVVEVLVPQDLNFFVVVLEASIPS
jgi:hypothetical protein